MKKVIVLAAVLALLAAPAFAIVSGTKHDLSSGGGQTIAGTADGICVYCHTPHGADVTGGPLWNRTNPAGPFTPYGDPNGTIDFGAQTVAGTDAVMCLSCHDGASLTGALQNPPNAGGANPLVNITGAANIGVDLSNDHPVGFVYTDVLAALDTELKTIAVIDGVLGAGAVGFGSANNEMWCSSCHDVHNNVAVPFLRIANTGSALCSACHIK